jgi:hypothetical protein
MRRASTLLDACVDWHASAEGSVLDGLEQWKGDGNLVP